VARILHVINRFTGFKFWGKKLFGKEIDIHLALDKEELTKAKKRDI
jgi:hypothetical protein